MAHLVTVVAHSIHCHIHRQLPRHWFPKRVPAQHWHVRPLHLQGSQSQWIKKQLKKHDGCTKAELHVPLLYGWWYILCIHFKWLTWPWRWLARMSSDHGCSVADRSSTQTWASLWRRRHIITLLTYSTFSLHYVLYSLLVAFCIK